MAGPRDGEQDTRRDGPAPDPGGPAGAGYEIRVKGCLDPHWRMWFEGMEFVTDGAGETRLRGRLADQAALHGLLARIRDLNLTLISVRRLADGSSEGEEEHVSA